MKKHEKGFWFLLSLVVGCIIAGRGVGLIVVVSALLLVACYLLNKNNILLAVVGLGLGLLLSGLVSFLFWVAFIVFVAFIFYTFAKERWWIKKHGKNVKGFTLIEVLFVLFIIIMVVVLVFSGGTGTVGIPGGCLPGYGQGEREGYVVKLAIKGIRYKSWEGEMQLGTGEQAAIQEVWHFSVMDPEVLGKIKTTRGKRVRLSYREWFIRPTDRETPYEITKLELLEK